MQQILVFLLAGGVGKRLRPLTEDRSKPAVPFGGVWRLIDFTLSNCINSGLSRIFLLTQYKSESLTRHIFNNWNFMRPHMGESINILPPQIRQTKDFYRGTSDAVYQNIYTLLREAPRDVLLVSGDHIYAMDYRPLIEAHHRQDADLTIATYPVTKTETKRFGVLRGDGDNRIQSFLEKPSEVPSIFAGEDGMYNGSMGVYVFKTSVLRRVLEEGPGVGRAFDFGGDIIPSMIDRDRVFLYPFKTDAWGHKAYWRDVGTLDSYFQAHMDLLGDKPAMLPHERNNWPLFHELTHNGPATVAGSGEGTIRKSIVGSGCRIEGDVNHSVLFPDVTIEKGARISHAVLMPGAHVEANAVVRDAILDKNARICSGCMLGMGPRMRTEGADQRLEYTKAGIVVVPKNEVVGFESQTFEKRKSKRFPRRVPKQGAWATSRGLKPNKTN